MNKKMKKKIMRQENSAFVDAPMSFETSEAFKLLRTNLSFSIATNGCKLIGVIGASPSIGKSYISVNLARSFSNTEKKVLLIDADLRLPTVAAKMGLPETPGLSNYLTNINADEVNQIISHFSDNVDVITAGDIPPNPSELLDSEKMKSLVNELKEKYDYIIFDLPPASVVSDALVVSKLIHGFLIVVRPKMDEKKQIRMMMDHFELIHAKVLGFVLNADAKDRSVRKTYYKNKYYYK